MTTNADARCFHCGQPIEGTAPLSMQVEGARRDFCCAGCGAVAQLISGAGLGRYYLFRQELGRRIGEAGDSQRGAWARVDSRASLWGEPQTDGSRVLLLQVEGMRCAACAWLIRSHLERQPGIHSVQVDFTTGFTRIQWDPGLSRLSAIATALHDIGYLPHLPIASAEEQGRRRERQDSLQRLGIAGLGMMQVMMYAVGLYVGEAQGMSPSERGFLSGVSLLLTLPVVWYSGRIFFRSAWRDLKMRRPGMDVPVALAIALAFGASTVNFFRGEGQIWFDSVVMFIFFLTLGRHVELVLRHRNVEAGAALARLLPEWAQRFTPTGTETVPAADLAPGDRVAVAAGEAFPADGEIVAGASEVDEAILTGESRPVFKRTAEAVVAGTINLSQPVEVLVSAGAGDCRISRLGRLLLSAQSRCSDEPGFPAWLVPAFVVAVLLLAGASWAWWQWMEPATAFPAALAVLVASCPCALSLALPAVRSAASRRLLRENILLTRGAALADLLRVDTVVFDKTGTLTRGHPEITRVTVNPARPEFDRQRVLGIAAALETHSAHPLARAFRPFANALRAEAVEHFAGAGLRGNIDGCDWRIGTAGHALSGRVPQPGAGDDADVWLADESGWAARFELADALRPGARSALEALAQLGLEVRISSGDSAAAVERVAAQVGVGRWAARQGPEAKLAAIRELQAQGRCVLVVGDGANDGPVLAAADVSITVQGAAELANSTADFILVDDSLAGIGRAFALARRSATLLHQNLAWALLYNASVMPAAMSGTLEPWLAALGMSLSSLLVVLNATRIAARRSQGASSAAPAGHGVRPAARA